MPRITENKKVKIAKKETPVIEEVVEAPGEAPAEEVAVEDDEEEIEEVEVDEEEDEDDAENGPFMFPFGGMAEPINLEQYLVHDGKNIAEIMDDVRVSLDCLTKVLMRLKSKA